MLLPGVGKRWEVSIVCVAHSRSFANTNYYLVINSEAADQYELKR